MRRTLLTTTPMMRRPMLVAMTNKTIPLMQLVRVMQNLLMIHLPRTSMNRTMPLYPRITLSTPRHLMRRPTMIGRLHRFFVRCRRLHPPLPTTTTLKIHLPRMMKSSLVLSHHKPPITPPPSACKHTSNSTHHHSDH
jgi:hypothetical protein